ncbi:MAG: aspartate-semialdehyde dehydrogenase [Clostridia bacterium]|nr:aspartate-semialdehyde dehydrogenase [Clostridia bacterium]
MEYNIAICGATGLVGRTVINELALQGLTNHNYKLFASKKSKGKKLKIGDKKYSVIELTKNSLFGERFDFALFCTGEDVSKIYIKKLAKQGTVVIDFSSLFRKTNPLIVPEINSKDIKGNIICNPNCSTIAGTMSLYNIHKKFGLQRIVYSTYQALSGAGQKAIKDLKVKNPKRLKKLDFVINNNLLPVIGDIKPNEYSKEENKMIFETKKILCDKKIKISATCVRVPIQVCHSESINFTTKTKASLNQIKECLKQTKGVTFVDNDISRLMPIYVKGKNDVYVGRLRKDEQANTFSMFIVSDNLKKGAAQNGVQILKQVIGDRYV